MNIKVDVNLTAPELAESIKRLAEALPNFLNANESENIVQKVRETEPTVKKSKRKSAEKMIEEIQEEGKDAQPNKVESKKITLEEVRSKLALLSQDGKQTQVKALITKFGAKKLSDIPSEQYSELLEEAEAL